MREADSDRVSVVGLCACGPPTLRRSDLTWVLCLALALGTAAVAIAQHEIDKESWIELRKMFREKGPVPTVEEDVAALSGYAAHRAFSRLLDRGPEVLPVVHAALLAPDVEPQQALRLMQVLGPLGHESSVPVLLQILLREPKSPLRRDALLTLARLPATDDAEHFISNLASSDEEWRTRRMAFAWFGLQRDQRGRPFAEGLLAEPDPERRAAGLFVLARLGDKTALEPVSQLLDIGAPGNSRDTLLLALAELVTPEEFERRAPHALAWSDGYKDALRYARYRTAQGEERPAICLEMLQAQMPGHLCLAVRCLLNAGLADDLRPFAAIDLEAPGRAALVRNEIRKAGWVVIDTEAEFRIERHCAK